MEKILILANSSKGVYRVRNELVLRLLEQYEVIICYHEVYVPTPYIVTEPINQGTYNYGTNPVTHALLDVLP